MAELVVTGQLTDGEPLPAAHDVPKRRLVSSLRSTLGSTPRKVLAGAASVVVLTGVLGALLAVAFGDVGSGFTSIGGQDAPLVEDSTGLYFSVNDMDAQVGNILLTGNAAALAGDRQQDLATYARDRQRAESDLQQVAVTAAADPAAQQAVSSVLDALGRYEALAADAILLNQRGRDPAGSPSAGTLGYYRQATDLMRTAVLPAAEALTSSNASSLDAAYRKDRSGALEGRLLVLVIGLAVTAALIELQVFLARRYRRLINPALAAATLLACGLAIAGAVQLDAQANYLKVAKQDAFDSILALTRARAVSYDANADETRYLVDPARAGRYQDSFLEKSQRLADVGNVGIQGYDAALATDISAYQANHADVRFGGYLGTEFRNITFTGEPSAATKALLAYQVYERDDRRLRALAAGGGAMTGGNGARGIGATASGGRQRLSQAIAFDIGTSPGQSDWAFSNWDAALGSLIAINEKAFTAATTAGTRTGSGWARVVPVVGIAVIAGLTVAGAWRRIGEYRLPFGKAGWPSSAPASRELTAFRRYLAGYTKSEALTGLAAGIAKVTRARVPLGNLVSYCELGFCCRIRGVAGTISARLPTA